MPEERQPNPEDDLDPADLIDASTGEAIGEGDDASLEESAEAAETTEVDESTETEEAADPDDKELLEALELKPGQAKPNRIPYPRVVKIIENARKKWAADHETQSAPLRQKVEQFERLGDLIEKDPEGFLSIAGQHINPRYGEIAKAIRTATEVPDDKKEDPLHDPADPMPEPNVQLQNGNRTYNTEGLQKLQEWHGRRIQKAVLTQVEQRLAPIQSRTAKEDQMLQLRQTLEDARTNWPGFKDFEGDLIEAMKGDRNLSLEGAYRKVVVPKLAELERRKVIEGLKKKAVSTSAGSSGRPAPKTQEASLDDRLSRVYDALAQREGTGV